MGKLASPNGQSYGYFGSSLGQSGSRLAVGTIYSRLSGISGGAAHVFNVGVLEEDFDGDEVLNYRTLLSPRLRDKPSSTLLILTIMISTGNLH